MLSVARILIVIVAVIGLKFLAVSLSAFMAMVIFELTYLLGLQMTLCRPHWVNWRIKNAVSVRWMCLTVFVLGLVTGYTAPSLFISVLLLLWVGLASPLQYRSLVFGTHEN